MFTQNQVLNGTYQILKPIGSGGTSSVYLAYHLRLQKYVVIKQIRGTFSQDFLMRTEVDILKNLHHPNLPQVYDFIQENDAIYTVIDYVDGYDLQAYIDAGTVFTEPQLKRYLRQMGQVLSYLHQQQPPVLHSDIKPANIIINQEGNAILIDFNISLGGNWGNVLGLTLPYASPEQIQMAEVLSCQQTPAFSLDGRSDLYSLGATYYELICGIRPTPGVPPRPLCGMGLNGYSHEFLTLIDRLIQYDREKRPRSAEKMVAALDRMDSHYRTYFALRCVSLLLSGVLLGGGAYCCIRGVQQQTRELYQTQISSVTQYISEGYLDAAEEICDEILDNEKLQTYMQDNPKAYCQFYHALGDIYYYREEFAYSAVYYKYAVQHCDAGDTENLSMYLRDAAIAFAQSGDTQTAQSILQTARDYSADSDDLLLVEVALNGRMGQTEQCLVNAEKLIAQCSQSEICLRAAICAAMAAPDIDTRISWLELACNYGGGRTTVRSLAAAYGEKAQQQTGSPMEEALEKAAELYRQLNDSDYASLEDRVNYSVILSMAGEYERAIDVLEEALEQYPGSDRVLMNLCFVYNQLGDSVKTSDYCRYALQAWKSNTSSDRLSETSDDVQNLMEIARRLGIGG